MRQFTHAVRCLSLALVLVAAFATLLPAEPASAKDNRDAVQWECDVMNGIYYETYEFGVLVEYGCLFLDDSEMWCVARVCTHEPAPNPEPHIGDPVSNSSQPAGGELVDQSSAAPSAPAGGQVADPSSPAPSAPADSYRPGYEYKMIER